MKKQLLILLCLASCTFSHHRVHDYNLNFGLKGFGSPQPHWVYDTEIMAKKDHTEIIHGRVSTCFVQQTENGSMLPMVVVLSQRFIIPLQKKGSVEISLNNKCKYVKNAHLSIIAQNNEEETIYQNKIDINSSHWKMNQVSFPAKNIRFLSIEIESVGDTVHFIKNDYQSLWLDTLEINVAGKPIEFFQKEDQYPNYISYKRLNASAAFQLQTKDNQLEQQSIPLLNNKKIIGIGECIHGSSTINHLEFELIKNRILTDNCKLVLLEMPVNVGMQLNQYVNGKFETSYLDQMNDLLSAGLVSWYEFKHFITWLREYNKTATVKVNLLGIDNIGEWRYGHESLFEFLATFMNKNTKEDLLPLLKILLPERYNRMAINNYLDNHKEKMQEILGIHYGLFEFVISQFNYASLIYRNPVTDKERFDDETYRDYTMWLNLQKIISIYLHNNEKVVVWAHSDHLTKINACRTPFVPSLGFYIKKKYGKDYAVLSITAGGGFRSIKTDNNVLMKDTIEAPLASSFENIASNTGLDYFLYPTNLLINPIYVRDLGDGHYNTGGMAYINLKNRIDGIIYIKESKSLEQICNNPDLYDKYCKNIMKSQSVFLKKWEAN